MLWQFVSQRSFFLSNHIFTCSFLVEQDQHFDGNSWRELFDVVIAQANKPTFYNSDHPFRLILFESFLAKWWCVCLLAF
jgi:hypothetical protein